ncbi:ATP-binding protein [Streptomyces sp. NPDC001744]|uniref:ATP-binding protein n=1 Tax=Streptomyces sp. NPDC001744 TaxID=3364606 RepID=UPI0036C3B179
MVDRTWLLPSGFLAGATVAGLLLSPAQIRPAVAWCGLVAVVLTAVVSAWTARRLRSAEAARHTRARAEAEKYYEQREATLLGRLADQLTTTAWLAEELLPAAVTRLQRGEAASDILHAVDFGKHIDDEFAEALKGALRTVLEAVEGEEHTRDASQRALVAVARRVQAIVHQLAKDLHAMQILHGNDIVVSRGLQDVDHRNALIGRLAASIAVLGDARPGRQWSKAIPLYDVLRGAMSRIVDYPRVKLQAVAEVAVIGPGAEPLIHLLAELLDNATSFSPPHTPVEVTANEVPSGVAIEIEDRGVGLTEEVRQRVERVMEQSRETIQLASLGEVTQLGLPVVSRLAREHGCEVHLRTSAYGGVRAVVLVPRRLITTMPQPTIRTGGLARRRVPGPARTAPMPARTAPAPIGSAPTPAGNAPAQTGTAPAPTRPAPVRTGPAPAQVRAVTAADSGGTGKTVNGLPQRRRETPVPPPVVVTSSTPPPSRSTSGTAPQPGLMWEAFNGDKRSGAEPLPSPSEPSDEDE